MLTPIIDFSNQTSARSSSASLSSSGSSSLSLTSPPIGFLYWFSSRASNLVCSLYISSSNFALPPLLPRPRALNAISICYLLLCSITHPLQHQKPTLIPLWCRHSGFACSDTTLAQALSERLRAWRSALVQGTCLSCSEPDSRCDNCLT